MIRASLVALSVLLAVSVAGCEPKTEDPVAVGEVVEMKLESVAFGDGGEIPLRYVKQGAGGENVSIPYDWSGAPDGTKSFALLLMDTHPVAHKWVHWMVVNIPADVSSLGEGASGSSMPDGSVELDNTGGTKGYSGPLPPIGSGDHEYLATVYALDAAGLEVAADAGLPGFLAAIEDHILAQGRYSGMFGRQ